MPRKVKQDKNLAPGQPTKPGTSGAPGARARL
jgi:hypothetical protein